MEYDNKVLKKHYELEIKRQEFIIERANSKLEFSKTKLEELERKEHLEKLDLIIKDEPIEISDEVEEERKEQEENETNI